MLYYYIMHLILLNLFCLIDPVVHLKYETVAAVLFFPFSAQNKTPLQDTKF
jgi:hypothetical protein